MAFGDLLELVGSTGRFQILHVSLLCVPVLLMASHNLLQNFVALVPAHYCNAHSNISESRLSPQDKLKISVPLDASGKPDRCQRYTTPQWHLLNRSSEWEEEEFEVQGCTDGWSYNMTEMSSTIISDWHLVCDLRSLKQVAQTTYMGGVLAGAVVFGGLSDKYGRRILLLMSYLLMGVSGTCVAFSRSFSMFCLGRFFCGMALSGISLNTFSLIVEWIPTRVRTVVGTMVGYCYTVGQMILALVAYFIRDWRWMTLAVSLPFYMFFLYAWWFHESSRWLVLSNKSDQAIKTLKSVAGINGRAEEGDKIDLQMVQEAMKKELSSSKQTHSVIDLFRTPTMRKMTLCLSAAWLSTSFAYYGLAMDLQKFGVNIYLIQVIFGAVDIPAKLIMTLCMGFIGRRPSLSGALILAGVTILINLLVPSEKQVVRTALAVMGKGLLAASFNCCYLYAGELFPTIIRQNGMGWVSMIARVGSMVAPLVLLWDDDLPWLPGLIYGGAPIISGLTTIFLLETLGSPLPDTMQDVEDRGSGRRSKTLQKEAINLKDIQADLLKPGA